MMRGIDALSRREYSRLELYRKLMRTLTEGETADDVIAVLDDLQAKGYLSDERYAEGRVRVRSMRYGNRRVAQELRQQGVDADAITAAMEQTEPEIDRARASGSVSSARRLPTTRKSTADPVSGGPRLFL